MHYICGYYYYYYYYYYYHHRNYHYYKVNRKVAVLNVSTQRLLLRLEKVAWK